MKPILVGIFGPTASGKTSVAIAVAKAFHTVVLSCDSRQFYKEVSIGTAKPAPEELAQVPHHFISNKHIWETYTAGDFARDALHKLQTLYSQHRVVILCGGSGMYAKAVFEGLDALPQADETLRMELQMIFKEQGLTALQQYLLQTDSDLYLRTELQNPQRVMRAIEIAKNKHLSIQADSPERSFVCLPVGLDMDRALLYERINNRVDHMVANGLEAEAHSMLPYRHTYAMQTVGYAEWFDYFDGKTSREEAIGLIKQHTRNYAKKQLTWFRKTPGIRWFHPSDTASIIQYIHDMMAQC